MPLEDQVGEEAQVGLGFKVYSLGFGVWGFGFRVSGSVFGVWDVEFGVGVWGSGCGVSGSFVPDSGFRVSGVVVHRWHSRRRGMMATVQRRRSTNGLSHWIMR